jgi:hypothetical protein
MGTWGVGLYANDDAADLRDDFKEIARMNWNRAGIVEWVREEFPLAADRKAGCSDVHLALADLFWLYGIDYAGVQEISANTQIAARAIVLPNASVGARRLGSDNRADAPPPPRNLRSLSHRGSQVPPATPPKPAQFGGRACRPRSLRPRAGETGA